MVAKTSTVYSKEYRERKATKGLCFWGGCNEPVTLGTRYCESHAHAASKYGREVRQKNRTEVFTALGGKCTRCGLDDWRVLQLDHVNGDGAEKRRLIGRGWQSHKRHVNYILEHKSDYQLLCANCHVLKGIENGDGKPCRWCDKEKIA